MAGNVFEIVNDFCDVYPTIPETDPTGPGGGSRRVARGGGPVSPDDELRTSARSSIANASASEDFGFRCAR